MVVTDAVGHVNLLRRCQTFFFTFLNFFSFFGFVLDLKHCGKYNHIYKDSRRKKKKNATEWMKRYKLDVNRGEDLTQSACIELHTVS